MAEATTVREKQRAANVDLARSFYRHHELILRKMISAKQTEADYSGEQFDDWAVTAGYMTKRAIDSADLERGGAMMERQHLRERLNRAARRGDGLDRAFTVEAKHHRWRIVLLERFVVEQPSQIVGGIRSCLERSERSVDQVKAFLGAQENLSQEDQLRCLMRLDMAQMFVFNGLQMLEMMVMGFDASNPPNLKRLRRKMAEVLLRENKQAPRRIKKSAA